MSTTHLVIPAPLNSSSLRSRSSGSSTSSLSSTFSDLTSSTSASSSSPPNSKTNAFFASPFSTQPPSPLMSAPPPPPQPTKPRSLTADFFAAPIRPPSPPVSSTSTTNPKPTLHNVNAIHSSRIFPSRYTSTARRSPEFTLLNLDGTPDLAGNYHHRVHHGRVPSSGSESSSFASSFAVGTRLPTPPPPTPPTTLPTLSPLPLPHHPPTLHRDDTIVPQHHYQHAHAHADATPPAPDGTESHDEPTPRPADLEPAPLLHFERSLLLARQKAQSEADAQAKGSSTSPPISSAVHLHLDDAQEEEEEEEEPHAGSIISLPTPTPDLLSPSAWHSNLQPHSRSHSHTHLPLSPLALTFTIASPSPVNSGVSASTLRALQDRGTPTPTNDPSVSALFTNTSLPSESPRSLSSPPLSPPPNQTQHDARSILSSSTSSSRHDNDDNTDDTDTPAPKLRLLRSLGHGAFSTVWLAEDLSRVPLTLVSKKSVRDLRRRASGKEKEKERDVRDKEKEKEARGGREEKEREKEREREKMTTPEAVPRGADGRDGREFGEVDVTPRPVPPDARASGSGSGSGSATAASASTVESPRRQPSRLREGLRSMLTFARPSTAAAHAPSPSNNTVNATQPQPQPQPPSPVSPLSPTEPASAPSGGGDTTLSRTSSLRSSPSGVSEMSVLPLSRNSSGRSVAAAGGGAGAGAGGGGDAGAVSRHSSFRQRDLTLSLSRDASLKKFRARVKGTRPAFRLGRAYLDERDGEMGVPRDVDVDAGAEGRRRQQRRRARSGSGSAAVSAYADTSGSEEHDVDMEPSHYDGDGGGGGGVGLGSSLSRRSSLNKGGYGRLVAVKMTARRAPRAGGGNGGAGGSASASASASGREKLSGRERQTRREEEERTRVRFVREVEVLKHISHPNITPLLAHLSTATHHILVLPYLPGGDLLGLLNNDVAWGKLSESVLRRIWFELCKAVGWMHGVGLVHRDIKLENILLTTPTFSSLSPSSPVPKLASLPLPPAPFIKLTDFGLSRFVEIDANGDAEMLSTRCGSEAYAAPELVTGGGVYDARKTDAWACGVVLYALVGRQLPFGEGVGAAPGRRGGSKIGGERGIGLGGSAAGRGSLADRRHWLMRIARGEWEWPGGEEEQDQQQVHQSNEVDEEELVGPRLVKSRGARRIVSRLLVRDPRKRARICDLWDDVWMCGGEDEVWWREKEKLLDENDTTPHAVEPIEGGSQDAEMQIGEEGYGDEEYPWDYDGPDIDDDVEMRFYDEPTGLEQFGGEERDGVDGEEEEEDQEEDEEEEDGCLLDHEGIDSITRQEVI